MSDNVVHGTGCKCKGCRPEYYPTAAPPVVVPVDAVRDRSVEFGCFTGDCPHANQGECNEAIEASWCDLANEVDALRSRLTAVEQELKSWEDLTNVHGDGQRLRDQHRALLAAARSPSDADDRALEDAMNRVETEVIV